MKQYISKHKYLLGSLWTFCTFAVFVATPLNGDLKVFMAGAKQASYISRDLLVGAYSVWDIKSVFSRLVPYLMYKLVPSFISFHSYSYEVAVKLIYSIFIWLTAWGAVRLVYGPLPAKGRLIRIFLLASFFFATPSASHMQVEMTCTLLLLWAFALYVNAIRTKKNAYIKVFAAGIFIGALFYFKSILIILSVSFVAAVALYCIHTNEPPSIKRMAVCVISSFLFVGLNALVVLYINPHEFRNMLDAAYFQNTVLVTPSAVLRGFFRFGFWLLYTGLTTPVYALGLSALAVNFFRLLKERSYKRIFYHFSLWFFPFCFIMISSCFWSYHYLVFTFPCVIEMLEFKSSSSCAERDGKFITVFLSPVCTVVCLAGFLLFSAIPILRLNEFITETRRSVNNNEAAFSEHNVDQNETFLYLDDGKGAYYIGAPSYLSYFYPLPLQRDKAVTLQCHDDALEKALAYDGKYISVYESWFFGNGRNAELKEKINREYDYLCDIDTAGATLDPFDHIFSCPYQIYVRKPNI